MPAIRNVPRLLIQFRL